MADNYKPDSKVDMNSRKFTSKYGYSRDIDKVDIPAANYRDESTLHNETSLNNNPNKESTIDQRTFKVPSANSALKTDPLVMIPIVKSSNELSKYFGATPPADKQYDQYSRSFE